MGRGGGDAAQERLLAHARRDAARLSMAVPERQLHVGMDRWNSFSRTKGDRMRKLKSILLGWIYRVVVLLPPRLAIWVVNRSWPWGRPVLDYVEFHLTDHCNLNCAGCTHFAPYADKRFADIKHDGVEFNVSNCPRVGFGELNVVVERGGSLDALADFLQVGVDYVMNHFNRRRFNSYNIFFYRRDEKIFAKVMSRYATSPYFVGYNIHFLPNNVERVADEVREIYFNND